MSSVSNVFTLCTFHELHRPVTYHFVLHVFEGGLVFFQPAQQQLKLLTMIVRS